MAVGWRRPACGCVTGAATVADAAARVARRLEVLAPDLVGPFRAALPAAAASVSARLAGALWREEVGRRERLGAVARRHGFDRVELVLPDGVDPVELLPVSVLDRRGWGLAAELTDAVVNLAIGYARAGSAAGFAAVADGIAAADRLAVPAGADPVGVDADRFGVDPDGAALAMERLAVEGHNLHPCARTRLGWSVADVLAHDLEGGPVQVAFVAVPRRHHVGDDVGEALAAAYPQVPPAPAGHVRQPVHPWQLGAVLRRRWPDLVRPLPGGLPAVPTASLRTVLLPPGADGRRRYLKLSLDVQITSTRRTISVASTRNGPVLSGLLRRLVADDPAGGRLLLLAETAGAALHAGSGRDASAILRGGLGGRLEAGEVAVPGGALPARAGRATVLGLLVDRYAVSRGRRGPAAALGFLTEYARLLLPPLLRLATCYGVALEAHLQNCLPTFVAGVPRRMVLRDFAGLRLHRPRLAAAGLGVALWPGSVVVTDDVATMRAKLGYTAFQAHLGELVVSLAGSHGLDEAAAWRAVRQVVDETYQPLRADPRYAGDAAADHAAWTAARVPHKALVRMRLAGSGDVYVPVRNPLHPRWAGAVG